MRTLLTCIAAGVVLLPCEAFGEPSKVPTVEYKVRVELWENAKKSGEIMVPVFDSNPSECIFLAPSLVRPIPARFVGSAQDGKHTVSLSVERNGKPGLIASTEDTYRVDVNWVHLTSTGGNPDNATDRRVEITAPLVFKSLGVHKKLPLDRKAESAGGTFINVSIEGYDVGYRQLDDREEPK